MQEQRTGEKRLIGAKMAPELSDAIDTWLVQHPGKSITDFLVSACLEKLGRSGIAVEESAVLRDGRTRVPETAAHPVNYKEKSAAGLTVKAGSSYDRKRGKKSASEKISEAVRSAANASSK